IEHGLLPRGDVRLAVVHRKLVGDERVLRANSKDRPMCDHAVLALVRARGRDDDHLAFGLRETALLLHQRVVVGEERAEFGGPMGEREEDIRHESRLLLDGEDALAHVLRKPGDVGNGIAADGLGAHAISSEPAAPIVPSGWCSRERESAATGTGSCRSGRALRRPRSSYWSCTRISSSRYTLHAGASK